ncbi:fructosamine kinase family protein [Thermasporomyces composti]|jgi:fructosamine-3-kinase|uniref:Fructosamine-3-kinase n=1 Tax=Thermasporomyces composti TaxID=696763 RepID=A0A3D9V7B5_THECX|nr:fructosamine kinase family protein [Thermasporomyces composti]REF36593.1 fructosamine-3-kinase [Thermasporomyces composti]
MARQASIAYHVEGLLGTAVIATSPVAGGNLCVATRVRLGDGRSVFVKTRPGAPESFFATEARNLAWLRAAGEDAAAVPEVLGYDRECLVLSWVETGRPTPEAAERLGRALAHTHLAGAPTFGAEVDGFIGPLPQPNAPSERWPEFYGRYRVEPYLRMAFNRGRLDAGDANAICGVLDHLDELAGPPEPPARIHGDLWSGNIIWSPDGVPRLVDPAAYGGHRESDLATLVLFGAPHLDRLLAAYQEVYPLADGWRDRLLIHHLHPLLAHAAMYGGSYGARAGQVARRILSARQRQTSGASLP